MSSELLILYTIGACLGAQHGGEAHHWNKAPVKDSRKLHQDVWRAQREEAMVDMAQREGATKRLEGGAEEGGRVGGGTQRWGRRWEQRRLGSRWRGLGLSLHEWWRGLVEPVADLSILYSTAGPPERFDCRQGGVRRDWADVVLKLVTHGFESSASSPFIQGIKDEWLAAARREGGREVRVLVLDWEVEAEGLLHYDRASTKAVAVGRALGACLAHLVMVHGLAPGRVHLVGHSLGGHLVGVAGREVEWLTGARLARVTGLDPAGPHWVGPKYSHTFPGVERLSRESAEVVDVIHTNGESSGALTSLHWGALQPLGHVDFYPDGGRNQRSCRFRMWDLLHPKAYAKCSHSLAQQYFMQSIRCPHRFRSQKCESFEKCTSGKGVEVFMGNKLPTIVVDGVKKIATGVWYTDVRRPGEC